MSYRQIMTMLLCLLSAASQFVYANASKLVGNKLAFEQYQISAPFNVSLPVITVDLITNEQYPAQELVIIGEDENKQKWLAAYVLHEKSNAFILLDKLPISDNYFAYDVSENNQGLYFLSKNEVVTLKYSDGLSESEGEAPGLFLQAKQSVDSIYLLEQSSFIAKKDFIQDINNDGLDDIILADFEQTNLWLKEKNKSGYFFQSLAINPSTELFRDSVNFTATKLFYADLTLDGLQDIAWISTGKINYFSQTKQGRFTSKQTSLKLANTIEGVNWWKKRESDGQSPDQSNLKHRVVEKIEDINGDGLVDVVVRFTQSSGVLDRANDYEFYLGYRDKSLQLAFPDKANTVIKSEGTLTGLKIIDVNNDNKLEVLLSSFELSVSNLIGVLLSGSIDQNVLMFSLSDDDVYFEDPIISKEVELSFSLTSGQSGQPIVLLSDVNGDDLQDLLLSSGEDQLQIFLGQNSDQLFNRRASKHSFLLPKNGELFDHNDINLDGKADFIMRYGRLDDKSMVNKVTILLVK